jgi:hypothetical protein
MALTNQNFDMWEKDTIVLQFTITNGENDPIDITDATITWIMYRGSTSYIVKENGAGVTITNGTNGVCQVLIEPTDTNDLAGIYYHELVVTDVSGNKSTVASGIVTIHPASSSK